MTATREERIVPNGVYILADLPERMSIESIVLGTEELGWNITSVKMQLYGWTRSRNNRVSHPPYTIFGTKEADNPYNWHPEFPTVGDYIMVVRTLSIWRPLFVWILIIIVPITGPSLSQ